MEKLHYVLAIDHGGSLGRGFSFCRVAAYGARHDRVLENRSHCRGNTQPVDRMISAPVAAISFSWQDGACRPAEKLGQCLSGTSNCKIASEPRRSKAMARTRTSCRWSMPHWRKDDARLAIAPYMFCKTGTEEHEGNLRIHSTDTYGKPKRVLWDNAPMASRVGQASVIWHPKSVGVLHRGTHIGFCRSVRQTDRSRLQTART